MKWLTKKRALWIFGPLVALALTGAGAFYWMLNGSSAPPLALSAQTAALPASASTDLSGRWTVVAGPADGATTAGYRVKEKVAGGIATDTATGRTHNVSGSVTVVGRRMTAAGFTVNMTTLKSDKSLRDTVLKTVGIETGTYPTASFTLTAPIVLPDVTPGKIYEVEARGTLQLHGVARSVTVRLQCQQRGTDLVVLADVPIAMADYAIKAPSVAGVVSVDHNGSFELLVNLAK